MNKKIFIILPHKDQFIKNYAGSASIWVKDFFKYSNFKNKIQIFGSTKNTKNACKIYTSEASNKRGKGG